jgi:hypothetical protein
MAKRTGLGAAFYLDQYDLSGDVGSVDDASMPHAVLGVTAIDKRAQERLHGLKAGQFEFTSFFNDAAGQEHPALRDLPRTPRYATFALGSTIGEVAGSLRGLQTSYDPNRGDDGSLTLKTSIVSDAYTLEWGKLLTAGKRTDTGATNGSSLDTAASAAFGLQAYLHVTAFTGTDMTVTVQDSADNSSFAAVTGASQAVTAVGGYRFATSASATVRRYLRVATSTSGGFTSATFVLVVVKNKITPVF